MQIKRWKADVLFLAGVLLIGAVFALIFFLCQKEGARVQIWVAGELMETLDLSEDCTYQIQGVKEGTNVLVIQDGEAWMQEASCPDGLCVNMGTIKRNGQSIICLPNQVVVEVVDQADSLEDSSKPDAVAGGRE